MMSTGHADLPIVQPKTRSEWRRWLRAHHATSRGAWLIVAKKDAGIQGVSYDEAVEEALCFGWIDGQTRALDARRFKLRMTPRKPGSTWAKSNKVRIATLVKDGRMTPAGLAKIEAAKRDGTWTQLEAVDHLEVPEDLQAALGRSAEAQRNFDAFSESSKKMITFWIASAKRGATRSKRIAETVRLASKNLKPGSPSQ
jgi:uncharacterized protein YdeI (YjbR/CyaY-like superfamily)